MRRARSGMTAQLRQFVFISLTALSLDVWVSVDAASQCSCAVDTSSCNCSLCEGYMAGKCCVFDGVSATIASLEDDPLWAPRISEWNGCTGANVNIIFIDEDDMQDEVEADVGVSYRKGPGLGVEVSSQGADIYDVYHIQPTFLPSILPNIENLSPWIQKHPEIQWSDVNPLTRKAVLFNNTVRALPLDTDYIAFGYREDLLQQYGKTKPETLEEMVDLAEFFHGKDLDGDGEDGDFGFCTNTNSWTFFTFMAPLLLTGTDYGQCIPSSSCTVREENLFMDAVTMSPFWNTSAFRYILPLVRRVVMASNLWSAEPRGCRDGDGFFCDRKRAYMTGRCAMFISLPGTTTRMIMGRNRPQHCQNCPKPKLCERDNLDRQYAEGCSVTNPSTWEPQYPNGTRWYTRREVAPGSSKVWDKASDTMVDCTLQRCPNAYPHPSQPGILINPGTYFPEGGESYAMRASIPDERKEMMFQFLTRLSTLHIAEAPLAGNYRNSQSSPEYQESFQSIFGWDRQVVEDLYSNVLANIFGDKWNTAQDLILLGHTEYMKAVTKHFFQDYFGIEGGSGPLARGSPLTPEEQNALDEQLSANLTAAWHRITGEWGPLLQNERWRSYLSLPDLPQDVKCQYYFEDMRLRDPTACILACPAGQFDAGADSCQPCLPGTYKPKAGVDECRLCQPGFRCPAGSQWMQPCPPGTNSSEGSDECSPCPAGTAASAPATDICQPCQAGFYQPTTGSPVCEACEMGRYKATTGAVDCDRCPPTFTTETPGSADASDCGCGRNFYMVSSSNVCEMCPEGLTCDSFDQMPLVDVGYYMRPDDPRDVSNPQVWKCASVDECPGQTAANDSVCASNARGLNCGQCDDGYYKVNEECASCEAWGGGWITLAMFIVAYILGTGCLHYFWNHDRAAKVEAAEGVLASVTVGETLAFMQSLGVMGKLDLHWPESFQYILSSLSWLFFDLNFMGTACTLPAGLASDYSSKILVPAVLIGFVFSWYLWSRLFSRVSAGRFPIFSEPELSNTVGLLVQALYISLASSTLTFVDCYSSPNNESTIRDLPYAICGSEEYLQMLPVFIVGVFIYIIGINALFAYMLLVAPSRYLEPVFRCRVRFLVFNFRPNRWWAGLLLNARSFALAMVTVPFPDDAYHQFLAMLLILIVSFAVQLALRPYEDRESNAMETSEIALLICILAVGSWFASERDPESEEFKHHAVLLMALVGLSMLIVVGVCLFAMYLAAYPGKRLEWKAQRIDASVDAFLKICTVIASRDREEITGVLRQFDYIDLETLEGLLDMFLLELCSIQPNSSFLRMRLPSKTSRLTELTISGDLVSVKLEHMTKDATIRMSGTTEGVDAEEDSLSMRRPRSTQPTSRTKYMGA